DGARRAVGAAAVDVGLAVVLHAVDAVGDLALVARAGGAGDAVVDRVAALVVLALLRAQAAAVGVGLRLILDAVDAGIGHPALGGLVAEEVGAVAGRGARLAGAARGAGTAAAVDVGLGVVAHAVLAVVGDAGVGHDVADAAVAVAADAAATVERAAVGARGAA